MSARPVLPGRWPFEGRVHSGRPAEGLGSASMNPIEDLADETLSHRPKAVAVVDHRPIAGRAMEDPVRLVDNEVLKVKASEKR
jgi:hypothetical protein